MTLKEIEAELLKCELTGNQRLAVMGLFVGAIADETRRCADKAENLAASIESKTLLEAKHADTRGTVQGIINRLRSLRNDILITGGLEVEE